MLSDDPFWNDRQRLVVILVAVIIISSGTAVAVTLTALDFNPLEPGQGPLTDSALAIESEQLNYQGLNATGVTLTVNNTDAGDHTGNVTVLLRDTSDGSAVGSATATGITFTGGTTTDVTVSFTNSHNVTTFDTVEVRIEETG